MRRLLIVVAMLLVPHTASAAAPRMAVLWGTVPTGINVEVLIDHAPVAFMVDPVTGLRLSCPTAPPSGATCFVVSLAPYTPGSNHLVTVQAVNPSTGLRSLESNALQAMVPLPEPSPANTPRPTNTPTAPNAPALISVTPF